MCCLSVTTLSQSSGGHGWLILPPLSSWGLRVQWRAWLTDSVSIAKLEVESPVEGMADCFRLHCQAGGWESVQWRAWLTASTSIAKLEVETVWATLSLWTVVAPCLTVKPPPWLVFGDWTIRVHYEVLRLAVSLSEDQDLWLCFVPASHCCPVLSHVFWPEFLTETSESVWVPFPLLGLLELCQRARLAEFCVGGCWCIRIAHVSVVTFVEFCLVEFLIDCVLDGSCASCLWGCWNCVLSNCWSVFTVWWLYVTHHGEHIMGGYVCVCVCYVCKLSWGDPVWLTGR